MSALRSVPLPSEPLERRSDASVAFEARFPRAHKRALGAAVGLTVGATIFLLTVVHVALNIEGLPIGLLDQVLLRLPRHMGRSVHRSGVGVRHGIHRRLDAGVRPQLHGRLLDVPGSSPQ